MMRVSDDGSHSRTSHLSPSMGMFPQQNIDTATTAKRVRMTSVRTWRESIYDDRTTQPTFGALASYFMLMMAKRAPAGGDGVAVNVSHVLAAVCVA